MARRMNIPHSAGGSTPAKNVAPVTDVTDVTPEKNVAPVTDDCDRRNTEKIF